VKSQVRPLIPRSGETLFCNTLVVGETLAAYTAVLAILRQGGTVCWVTATEGLPTLTQGALMPEIAAPQGPQALGAVLWGNRYRLPPAGYLSQSQWDFWQRNQQRSAATPPLLAETCGDRSPRFLTLTRAATGDRPQTQLAGPHLD
jgi:hypothetical protein